MNRLEDEIEKETLLWRLSDIFDQVSTYPLLLVLAQSKTLCMAVTPSLPIGAISPPVIIA